MSNRTVDQSLWRYIGHVHLPEDVRLTEPLWHQAETAALQMVVRQIGKLHPDAAAHLAHFRTRVDNGRFGRFVRAVLYEVTPPPPPTAAGEGQAVS